MLMAPMMPSSASAPSTVSRVQWPHGAVPQARSPRGLRAWVRTRLVSTALSSMNTKRFGSIASSAVRQLCRAALICAASCSVARKVFFFARQSQAPECPAHRPGMNAHAGRIREPVPVLRQG